ncbi:MAG: hypothetical protein ACPHDV_06320 [Parvibaculales bacterium]
MTAKLVLPPLRFIVVYRRLITHGQKMACLCGIIAPSFPFLGGTMEKLIRILAIIMALPLALIAVRWVVDPSGAAQSLEMTLLEGAARNSQIGDTTACRFTVF